MKAEVEGEVECGLGAGLKRIQERPEWRGGWNWC